MLNFNELDLKPEILKAIDDMGFETTTPIQEQAIPIALTGRDVIGQAQTGTGKTAAFSIPFLQMITAEPTVQVLILTPTRELCMQVEKEIYKLSKYLRIKSVAIYGGQEIGRQIKSLREKPQVIVATPGRLMDHYKRHTISFDKVQTVVLDEADRMLDMGFFDDVTKIIEKVKNRRNLGLFSATISQEVMTVSWMYQRDEVEITVAPTQESKPDIDQYSITVPRLEKEEAMLRILRSGAFERVIVFCNTKVMCQRLRDDLVRMGLDADCIHGDIPQKKREAVMARFRRGELPIFVATDVAARGIDVDDVDAVFNYDVPLENEYYVHRIGRTGRAKRRGVAYTLVSDYPSGMRLDGIAKFTGNEVKKAHLDAEGKLVED